MLPAINQEALISSIVHPVDQLGQSSPKHKKRQPCAWNDKMRILSFTLPQAVQSPTFVRKFKIRIVYQNQQGKKIPKTLFFGDDSDYVFNKDKVKRHLDNPLHANYWKALLLNKYQTMQQGLAQFTKYYIQQQKQMDLKRVLQPRQCPPLRARTLVGMIPE